MSQQTPVFDREPTKEEAYHLESSSARSSIIPKRIRVNPMPPCIKDNCTNAVDRMQYREWVTKEWAVYTAYINQVRRQVKDCFLRKGTLVQRDKECSDLTRHYAALVSEDNLNSAKQRLQNGEILIPYPQ